MATPLSTTVNRLSKSSLNAFSCAQYEAEGIKQAAEAMHKNYWMSIFRKHPEYLGYDQMASHIISKEIEQEQVNARTYCVTLNWGNTESLGIYELNFLDPLWHKLRRCKWLNNWVVYTEHAPETNRLHSHCWFELVDTKDSNRRNTMFPSDWLDTFQDFYYIPTPGEPGKHVTLKRNFIHAEYCYDDDKWKTYASKDVVHTMSHANFDHSLREQKHIAKVLEANPNARLVGQQIEKTKKYSRARKVTNGSKDTCPKAPRP